MLVRDVASLVPEFIKYVLTHNRFVQLRRAPIKGTTYLQASFAEKLVAGSERDLYDCTEFCELPRCIYFYICDALKVGNELFHDCIPSNEALNKNIRGPEILGRNVLLDEGLGPREGRAMLACARDGGSARWGNRA